MRKLVPSSPPRLRSVARGGDSVRAVLGSVAPRETMPRDFVLDEVDVRILSILQRDGRISKTALGEMVNLSPSACLERVRQLEKKKLILSYHANVNIKALLGLHTFFTEITLRTHRADNFSIFERYVQKIDEIVECHALGGGIDYLLKLICPDVERYQALIDQILDAQVGVDRYFTYIQTKAVKTRAQLPIEALVATMNRA
jgi:Lrp/AsnC family transcriptional regulator, regulator of ectoine-degradation genes